jgi:hypothetical protein
MVLPSVAANLEEELVAFLSRGASIPKLEEAVREKR